MTLADVSDPKAVDALIDAAVGAFFPDSDRSTLALGFGLDWLDLAFAWTTFDQRIVSTSAQNLNGNYRANSWSFVMSATMPNTVAAGSSLSKPTY